MNNWHVVEICVKMQAVEAVEFALSEAGADGTELDLLGKLPEANETVRVKGFFAERPSASDLQSWLAAAREIYELPEKFVEQIEFAETENRDWLAEWKRNWKPTETEKFVVAPSWSKIENSDKIIIRIEPGMAFGTGTHETTRLCLQAIEDFYQPEMSFFDVGTGTGILAIGAAKIQKKSKIKNQNSVAACDTDENSIQIARANAQINCVGDRIEFCANSISENMPRFDFVAANVTADIIISLLPLLLKKSAKFLVLSGILRQQQDWVTNELEKLKVDKEKIKVREQGEWISIIIKNA
jgi:ribosomal protein L11 methyltransferase